MRIASIRHFEKLWHSLASAAIAVALVAILATSALWTYKQLKAGIRVDAFPSINLLACLLALVVGAAALQVSRRRTPYPRRAFLAVVAVAVTIAHLIVYLYLPSPWFSDFARTWNVAAEMIQAGDFHAYSIYHQRALPLAVPLYALSGGREIVVPLTNLMFMWALVWMTYDTAARLRGQRAGQCAAILIAAAAEPLASSNIPSHDFWGLVIFALYVWLSVRACCGRSRLIARTLALAAAGGLSLCLFELQRSASLFLLLAVALACIGSLLPVLFSKAPGLRSSAARVLLFHSVSIAVFFVAIKLASAFGLVWGSIEPPSGFRSVAIGKIPYEYYVGKEGLRNNQTSFIASHASSLSPGSWTWMQTFQKNFLRGEDQAMERDLAFSIMLTSVALEPKARWLRTRQRASRLFAIGSQTGFYFPKQAPGARGFAAFMKAYSAAYAALVSVLGLFALMRLLPARLRPSMQIVLLLPVLMAAALLFSAESQARYLYPIWLTTALLIAGVSWRRGGLRETGRHIVAWGLCLGLFILLGTAAVAGGWRLLTHFYAAPQGEVIAPWRQYHNGQSKPVQKIGRQGMLPRHRPTEKKLDFSTFAFALEFPKPPSKGETIEARTRVCAGSGDRRSLGFFLYTPYKNLKRKGVFDLLVLVDGRVRETIAFPYSLQTEWVEVGPILEPGRCAQVSIRLLSHVASKRDSWQRASRAEIYFPRLVR